MHSLMPTYARTDLAFERGEGAYLFGGDGRTYLDFASGVAVTSLGHCHPHLVAALAGQAAKLWHCSNLYRIPGQERLAERLTEASFADAAFFCNSGAEAVECCLKAARRYHDQTGNPGRYRVIAAHGAFHGRTLATIAAGGQAKHLEGFDPVVEGFDHVSFGNLDEARAAVRPDTAAILIEPVQGEGGIRPADAGYLRGLRALADESGILLIYDEVQCGMGRTGKLFAHQWSGVAPDLMAIAKGLGGGFPVGGCLAVDKVAAVMTAGSHGSTFGGNPLAMAVANAVLDVMLAEDFLEMVDAMGELLWRRLIGLVHHHPTVLEGVRGRGLMIGIKCRVPNTDLIAEVRRQGLLTVAAGDNQVRLAPPLIIEEIHVNEALAMLDRACLVLGGQGKA